MQGGDKPGKVDFARVLARRWLRVRSLFAARSRRAARISTGSLFDRARFLKDSPGAAVSGIDPGRGVAHGASEGRDFSPAITGDENAVPSATDRRQGERDDSAFRDFVKSNLDPERYRKIYRDVATAGVDPVEHWLNYGLYECRSMQGGLLVRRSKSPLDALGTTWRRFTWRGEYIAVCSLAPSPSLRKQIIDQSRHEPAVLPPKTLSIGCLPYSYRTETLKRDVDFESILVNIQTRPELVVVLPRLHGCEALNYAADLMGAIVERKGGSILVVVTEQTAQQAENWENSPILSPFRAVNLLFWRDVSGRSDADPRMLAIVLNFLRPRRVVIIESSLGFEAIARYGLGLSHSAKLYCAALGSSGNEAVSVAMRFIRRILPFALVLAEDEAMAEKLRDLYGELTGPGIAVLSPRLQPASDEVFAARLGSRQRRVLAGARPARWVWVSRGEPSKGAEILAALAMGRSQDQFEICGACEAGLEALGLALPNIIYRGVAHDIAASDFTAYDGAIFTSASEGMKVVLEMSQHAIPMVMADLDDSRKIFESSAVLFVRYGPCANEAAAEFGCALDRLVAMTVEEMSTMVNQARVQALGRHAPTEYARSVANLFELA